MLGDGDGDSYGDGGGFQTFGVSNHARHHTLVTSFALTRRKRKKKNDRKETKEKRKNYVKEKQCKKQRKKIKWESGRRKRVDT